MTLDQNRSAEILYTQLKYIYPFEEEHKIKERYDSVKHNSDEKSVEARYKNVKEYESLNFPSYSLYNSYFQKIIRNNSAHGTSTSALDFFRILSKQINDFSLNEILSIELITYLFDKTDINKQVLDPKGVQTLKKLVYKFPGYSPNPTIQFYLLLPSDNENDQKFSKISYNSNIEYLLSFELNSIKLPHKCFNSSLIDDLIIFDSDYIKKVSAKCLKMIGQIHEILGGAYLYEINGKQFQSKIIISQFEDKSMHEKYIQEFIAFLNELMVELRRSDLINESENLYVNRQVLDFLISDFKFDYKENLNFLYFMKQNLSRLRFNTKLIWSILKPEIYVTCLDEKKILIQNVKNLKNLLDSVKVKENLNLINTDFVNGLIEAECHVDIEQFNSIIRSNSILLSKKNQMVDLKTIKKIFKSKTYETTLDIDEIVDNSLVKNDADLSTHDTLDTDKISCDIDLRDSELEKSVSTKAMFNNDQVTILIDSTKQKNQVKKSQLQIRSYDFEYLMKIIEFILVVFSLFYVFYYLINCLF